MAQKHKQMVLPADVGSAVDLAVAGQPGPVVLTDAAGGGVNGRVLVPGEDHVGTDTVDVAVVA